MTGRHPCSSFLEVRSFLVRRKRSVVGRASAFINRAGPPASLGLFECEPDAEAARALFGAALDWLHGRGAREVWGPMNGTMWLPYRLRTRAAGLPSYLGEPYNKDYYPQP